MQTCCRLGARLMPWSGRNISPRAIARAAWGSRRGFRRCLRYTSPWRLYVLLARQCHRVFLVPALIFYALILFGSVHLGYHYFVDGIAGTAGTVGIWWMVGKLVSRPAPAEEPMGVPSA